jgi:hypothetical protein
VTRIKPRLALLQIERRLDALRVQFPQYPPEMLSALLGQPDADIKPFAEKMVSDLSENVK